MLVGVLFALSFDTVSQVVLFSLSASALAGLVFTGLMGVFFMLGMMTSDGLNGMLVSLLIQRADGFSAYFSRLIGFFVALFSLIIGLMKCFSLT